MLRDFLAILMLPGRHYFWGSFLMMLVAAATISGQMGDRRGFAGSELHADVMERWGAPLTQAAPSVRYVESGAVFNTLRPLGLDRQTVALDAQMNYRKRGLVYFSGFDFGFTGDYEIVNPEPHAIDVVFVFPVQHDRTSIISELVFQVNGSDEPLPLSETHDRLVWTGRLAEGETAQLTVGFQGRGLDAFTYVADPQLPVRNLTLDIAIAGGENFDYGEGVLPAGNVTESEEGVALHWEFESLESGFPLGVIVPSEKSFDAILLTMIRRAWATFVLFFVGCTGLALFSNRPLRRYEAYLISAAYAFFYVLLPYLAAYMHFYAAYALSMAAVGWLLHSYIVRLLGTSSRKASLALIASLLLVPTLAVILTGYTGLIYSLEILAGLVLLMALTRRDDIRRLLDTIEGPLRPEETADAV